MNKVLFYNEKLDLYEWQEMPDTKEEALDAWGNWWVDNYLNFEMLGNDDSKITPNICYAMISFFRASRLWHIVDESKEANKIEAFNRGWIEVPITVGYNMEELPSYLDGLNDDGGYV